MLSPASMVRVLSSRTVRPPAPRPRERIPFTSWDATFLSANYIQKGLLFHKPSEETLQVVDHLAAALADALTIYYPVAGRFATEKHKDGTGKLVGCSVHIDCDGQGVEVLHAVADGVSIADVIPPNADVPSHVVGSFFPLDDAVNYDAVDHPLFAVQVTDLADGVFIGFAYNHALSDGTAFWDFVNVWAAIARTRLGLTPPPSVTPPVFERWSADGGAAAPVVLPFADVSELIERISPPLLRERMLHFSAETLVALKERARQDLLAAGDTAGAAALTRFQALSSLLWRCITRARQMAPEQETTCRVAINNRARLRPQLPQEYFGTTMYAIGTEAVLAPELLQRGHGWAAAAVGRAVAGHTDAAIRERVAAWTEKPIVYTARFFDPTATMVGSSPRFDMYGCDFGWGRPVAVNNKSFPEPSKKLRRRQSKMTRDIKRPGEAIIKGHRSYDLMLCLQLGIRYTVGKITPIQRREVRASDYGPKASFWMNFPKNGSRLTPSHRAVDFKWKDYCPMVFRSEYKQRNEKKNKNSEDTLHPQPPGRPARRPSTVEDAEGASHQEHPPREQNRS